MDFFSDCNSLEEAKILYRRLAKCMHPDKCGDSDLMVELKRQYELFTPGRRSNTFLSKRTQEYESYFCAYDYWRNKCKELQTVIEYLRKEYPTSIWEYLKNKRKRAKQSKM